MIGVLPSLLGLSSYTAAWIICTCIIRFTFKPLYSPAIVSIYPLYRSISRFLRYFVHAPFTDCLHYQPGQGIPSLSILLKISVKACGKYTFMHNLNNLTDLQHISGKNDILTKRSKFTKAYMVLGSWENMSSAGWENL